MSVHRFDGIGSSNSKLANEFFNSARATVTRATVAERVFRHAGGEEVPDVGVTAGLGHAFEAAVDHAETDRAGIVAVERRRAGCSAS